MGDFLSGISIEKCRGIEIIDTDDEMILVLASVEQAAQALSRIYSISNWHRDVYSREIEVADNGILIFRFPEHSWTILHRLYSLPTRGTAHPNYVPIGEAEACSLFSPAKHSIS